MERQMKLRVRVVPSVPGKYQVFGQQYDGTPFMLYTRDHNVVITDIQDGEGQVAWLLVLEYAKQDDRSAITLPDATIEFGKNISVKDTSLMPLVANINMFRS